MKRLIKIILALLGVLVLAVIIAIVVAVLVIDPNKYKGEIAAAVHKATGRELTIPGDLHLSFFPWLGVETGAMSLSNAQGFGPEPFARLNAAAVHVRLLPLLRRDVEVDTVTLDGLTLHLTRNAAGVTNWSDLTRPGQNGAQGGGKGAEGKGGSTNSSLSAFAIGGVRVHNATLDWDDRQNKTHYRLYNLNLHTGEIALNAPVKLELDSDVQSDAPALSGHVALATQARYDAAAQHAQLRDLKLTLKAQPKGMAVEDANLTLTGNADLDLAAKHYRIEALHATGTARGAKLPGKEVQANLDAQVAADLNQQTLDVTGLKLAALNVTANGKLHGSDLLKAPHLTGTLDIPDFNARQLLSQLGMKPLNTADPNAFTAVGAALSFAGSTTAAELSQLQAHLDQTHLTGSASIRDFAHPAYRFQFNADQLDADRYLPPPSPEDKNKATTPASAGAAPAQLPVDTLRALNVDGALSVGRIKLARLTASDIKASLTAHNGVLHAAPLAAKLYGGSYRGDLQVDAGGKLPQLSTDEKLEGVDIGALGHDLLKKDLVAGTGSVQMKLSGTGSDLEALQRTLDGNLGFSLKDGRLNGVNLIALLKQDYVKYLRQLSINANELNQTVFSTFAATATVRNGLMETHDLVLNSAQLDVKGHGTVNLANQRVDLQLNALPVGEFGKQVQQYSTTAVPIKVEGTITQPHFSVAFDQVLKSKAKERINQEKQKLQNQLQDKSKQEQQKLEKQLQDKLKGLFK